MKLTQETNERGDSVIKLEFNSFSAELHLPDPETPGAQEHPVTTGFERVMFNSSMLSGGAYLEADEILRVIFVNGDEYEYSEVPSHVWEDLKVEESAGRYFNRFIKEAYSCCKLEEV